MSNLSREKEIQKHFGGNRQLNGAKTQINKKMLVLNSLEAISLERVSVQN